MIFKGRQYESIKIVFKLVGLRKPTGYAPTSACLLSKLGAVKQQGFCLASVADAEGCEHEEISYPQENRAFSGYILMAIINKTIGEGQVMSAKTLSPMPLHMQRQPFKAIVA